MLIEEKSVNSFKEKLDGFLKFWKEKEAEFIQYFEANYEKRTGKYIIIMDY